MLFMSLFGCEEPPPPPKPQMMQMMRPVLVLNTGVPSPGAPDKAVAFLHPEQIGPCHKFGATATLDGQPMTRLHGKVKGEFTYDRDCNVYEFALDPAVGVGGGTTSTLEITDGTDTARMVVDHLFAPRTVTAERANVKAGEEVVLAWSPATDVYDGKGDIGVLLTRDGEQVAMLKKDQVRYEGGAVKFTLPADVTPGQLEVEVVGTAFIQPHVAKCDWVVSCRASRQYTVPAVEITVGK